MIETIVKTASQKMMANGCARIPFHKGGEDGEEYRTVRAKLSSMFGEVIEGYFDGFPVLVTFGSKYEHKEVPYNAMSPLATPELPHTSILVAERAGVRHFLVPRK